MWIPHQQNRIDRRREKPQFGPVRRHQMYSHRCGGRVNENNKNRTKTMNSTANTRCSPRHHKFHPPPPRKTKKPCGCSRSAGLKVYPMKTLPAGTSTAKPFGRRCSETLRALGVNRKGARVRNHRPLTTNVQSVYLPVLRKAPPVQEMGDESTHWGPCLRQSGVGVPPGWPTVPRPRRTEVLQLLTPDDPSLSGGVFHCEELHWSASLEANPESLR